MTLLNNIPCRVLLVRFDGQRESVAAEVVSAGPKWCRVRLCEDVFNLRGGSKIKGDEVRVPRGAVQDRDGRPW